MFTINTYTKKFTEAVSLDLGQLPTVDTRIDFQLTDGSWPVIAEGKQFTMTIGTVQGTLYKTDENTVSFRYLQFDADNVSATLPIVISMDGVEILNDTISLTYQEVGGGDPFPQGGLVGDFLQKTATGQTWAEVPAGEDTNDYLCIEAVEHPLNAPRENWQIAFVLKNDTMPANPPSLEYSYDKVQWTPVTIGVGISLATSDRVYFRGDNNALSYNDLQGRERSFGFSNNTFRYRVYGNAMSLLDKTCQSTTLGEWAFYRLFHFNPNLVSAGGMKLPSLSVPKGAYMFMFGTCPNLVDVPELPATFVDAYGYNGMFNVCPLVSNVKVGFTEWPTGEGATVGWLNDTAKYGVFEAPATLPYVAGVSNVPYGWAFNLPADETDYLCIEKSIGIATDSFRILPVEAPTNTIFLEYSYDKVSWTSMTMSSSTTSPWIELSNLNPMVYLRGDNQSINTYADAQNNRHFAIQGYSSDRAYKVTGNIMSLIDKTCRRDDVPDGCFSKLFYGSGSPSIRLSADSDIRLPASRVGSLGYGYLFMEQPYITRLTELGGREWGESACVAMFRRCTNLEVIPSELHITYVYGNAFGDMFTDCAKLKSSPCIIFDRDFEPVQNWGRYMFAGCSNLSTVTVRGGYYYNGSRWTSWFGEAYTYNWLQGVANKGVAVGDWQKYISERISSTSPSTWVISYASNYGELAVADTIDTSTLLGIDQRFYKTIYPNTNKTLIIKAYEGGIILSVASMPKSQIAYAGVVIDYATGSSIVYDSDLLTLVDTLVEGKRNHCVVRWCNGQAKLFVVDTEDIPQG